ncbi:MAG TPA: class I SAM-dependent methyltransferase, partial [Steroidobacteraceae bacterium]|nr:class I SAM-dependent methyltransferase [Steroidobacteraceae bacterium]
MDARLQRRVQRYGWDLAAADYEALWQRQLAPAQAALLDALALRAGEAVLDVACGTGLASFPAADSVGAHGRVLGVDISGHMVEAAARGSGGRRQVQFARMDAEALALPAASFDVALCALGLMYLPDPLRAVREMVRVLRPGGRLGLAVWGERERCGWAPVFGIVDAEVRSDVCPLFFALGQDTALAEVCATAGLTGIRLQRLTTTLSYR